MAKKKHLSVAIAVFNEAKNVEACLLSIQPIADEIVVVDGGSTDNTLAIVRKFTSKIIVTDNPPIFHINKQKALDACTGDWILQLDADEIIPDDLKKEIKEVINNPKDQPTGYYFPRKNYFWGHWMKKGGQYPDYVIRLFRRGRAYFPSKSVHEQIEVEGKLGYLVHPMDHFSYRTKEDYWRKADTYTTLTALEMKKENTPNNVWTWFTYNILKPKLTFLSLYIRHKGFLDGRAGFFFALWSALHFPIAYRKFLRLLVVVIFFLICTIPVHADYVLPYPSYMPGNTMYKISRIIDRFKGFWFFGNIGQIKYHLGLSDKYLVEAKTLMEYRQYLLGADAMTRSDKEFETLPAFVEGAKKEGVDVRELQSLIRDAAGKHEEVLTELLSVTPATFTWTPEKASATALPLHEDLLNSRAIRIKVRQLLSP